MLIWGGHFSAAVGNDALIDKLGVIFDSIVLANVPEEILADAEGDRVAATRNTPVPVITQVLRRGGSVSQHAATTTRCTNRPARREL